MLVTLLVTLTIVAACTALLSVSVILKKNGKFPNTHIGANQALRDRGISCATSQDNEQRRQSSQLNNNNKWIK